VPILKGNDLLGVVGIYTLEEVRPFTDKQIALVETFADQAAIAIDNVRLLDELRQSLETLSADESNGGLGVKVSFERIIVFPDGQREIEGVTPKSLPAPDASHALPRPTDPTDDTNEGAA
jgi:hypothetical protein